MVEAVSEAHPVAVVSLLSDNCLPQYGKYKEAGFKFSGMLEPQYSLVVGRKSRALPSSYPEERFVSDSNLKHVQGATVEELFRLNFLFKVWDAWMTKWALS